MIEEKITTREALAELCEKLRSQGKRIGFTSGAFDLLHAGHVDYLEKTKALCDVLIVGVNSDRSIKKYKGEKRPLVSEHQRAKVVAALESVDYVCLFHERRNRKNIEVLKPDYYIKAGDYTSEELTSKDVVEKYGGEVRIIPIVEKISTSDIIQKIGHCSEREVERFVEEERAVYIRRRPSRKSPAVFLDRDGTINEEIYYLHETEKFELLPNAIKGIKKFQDMGYRIVIVSNQPGIGMGYYTKEDFFRVNREMLREFAEAGILIDKIYFCPHSKSEGCSCRKPNLALVNRAEEELNLDISHSLFIGDKTSDMETGRRAGMRTILVKTGFKGEDGEFFGEPDFWADDLLDAANIVLENRRLT